MRTIYLLLLFFAVNFFTSNTQAKELYCLKDTGFIYPEFKSENCLKNEIELSKTEYLFIKDIDREKRAEELIDVRKKQSKAIDLKVNEAKSKNNQTIKLSEAELNFKKKCEKNFFGFGNNPDKSEYNSCLLKERLKAQLEFKKKEKEKEEKAAVENKRKKELLDRQEAQKRFNEQREKEILARQVEINNKKKEKEQQLLSSQSKLKDKKKDNIEKQSLNTSKNKELLMFYIDRNISDKNLVPNVSRNANNLKFLDSLDDKNLKKLLSENEKIILISPQKTSAISSIIEEKNIASKFVVSSHKVVNNDYNRLQRELDIAGRNIMNAQSQANAADANTPAYCPPDAYNPGRFWSCLATQATGIALRSKWKNAANDFASQESHLASQLSNTSPYIDEKIYKPYDYKLTRVKATKTVSYNVVEINNDQIIRKNFNINDQKEFKILANLNSNDDHYSDLLKSGSNNAEIENWKKNKMTELTFEDLKANISKVSATKKDIKSSDVLVALELKKDYLAPIKNIFSSNKNN